MGRGAKKNGWYAIVRPCLEMEHQVVITQSFKTAQSAYTGHSSALHQKLATEADAIQFADDATAAPSAPVELVLIAHEFYAVRGPYAGVYNRWGQAACRSQGCLGGSTRRFDSLEDAWRWVFPTLTDLPQELLHHSPSQQSTITVFPGVTPTFTVRGSQSQPADQPFLAGVSEPPPKDDAESARSISPLQPEDVAALSKPFAAGAFGCVYRVPNRDGKPVALKKITRGTDPTKRTRRETSIWSRLLHPNVLPFLGTIVIGPLIYLISPWMSRGDINQYVQAAPLVDIKGLMLDVCHGMDYLHTLDPPIIHGDIKGNNILISDDGRALLSDFGLSRISGEGNDSLSFWNASSMQGAGAPGWMAPEAFDVSSDDPGSFRNSPFDIYSFAMTVYEVFEGRPPYANIRTAAGIIVYVSQGNRPDIRAWPLSSQELLSQCWDADPRERPSASQLIDMIPTREFPPASASLLPSASIRM